MNNDIKDLIRQEAKIQFPQPVPHNTYLSVGADLKQDGFVAGATAYAEHCIGFKKWSDHNFIICQISGYYKESLRVTRHLYTVEQLFVKYFEYLKSIKQQK